MGKLFGTDGIRGVVNKGLDAPLAFRVGMAAAAVLAAESGQTRPLFTIGKDTRISSDLLEGALIAGLCSAGADVMCLGVTPTPAVAWHTVHRGAQAGIVISASHNPFEHNGIKIFNGQGFKLSDALEHQIEAIVLEDTPVPLKTHGEIGRVLHNEHRAAEEYVAYLASTVDGLAGLRILVDCANGAAGTTAKLLFARFPALHVDIINDGPDGVNINANCGSTHIDTLAEQVKAGGYDLGIAFDGDADRCLAVDESGGLIDGDRMMAVCGADLKRRGELHGDTIVATIMSNLGLHLFARENGIRLLCTDVGDRHVLERMVQDGYVLGGEQSGHMIFLKHATAGDGQLAALQFLQILCRAGKTASALAGICQTYPQVLVNVAVDSAAQKQAVMSDPAVQAALRDAETALGDGRILLRPSGTEALIRVMVEGRDAREIRRCAETLAKVIKKV